MITCYLFYKGQSYKQCTRWDGGEGGGGGGMEGAVVDSDRDLSYRKYEQGLMFFSSC